MMLLLWKRKTNHGMVCFKGFFVAKGSNEAVSKHMSFIKIPVKWEGYTSTKLGEVVFGLQKGVCTRNPALSTS